MQSFKRQTCSYTNLTQILQYTHLRRNFARYNIPGKTFKTDCWSGLENTRTYLRGYVSEWNLNEGWGVLIDNEEKDIDYRTQCKYYVHWSDIAGLNIKHLDVKLSHLN